MRARTLAALLWVIVAATLSADTRGSKRDAELLKKKVAAIQQAAAKPVKKVVRTMVTEEEVNSYLAFETASLPTGVVDPSVSILGTGRLSGRAIVDLDAVRKAKNPTSLFDPMNFFMGRVPITAAGTFTTSSGVGRFQLESAAVGGVPVPKMVLQEIVSYYSRTPDNPEGFGLDDPFELPARIQEIQVLRGQAIIVQ